MSKFEGLSRRALLTRASALAAVTLLLPSCSGLAARKGPWGANPFTLGVASGDPLADGAVIWTRLLPFPDEPERTGTDPLIVEWRVATDEGMKNVVRRGSALAEPGSSYAVHVELRGLDSARPYWYQFSVAEEESAIGRFATMAVPGSPLERFRFALASCSHYEQGFFAAYRHMAEDAPDLVLHVGDYIYESSWGDPVRRHEGPEPTTLDDYRRRYALYRGDADLQRAHAAAPWLYTWDDHEVENDYAADLSENGDDPALFVKRRSAAYQDCFEHMPLRRSQMLKGLEMRLYQRNLFGDLIDLHMLDNRQYRSDHACEMPPRRGGASVPADCPELFDEKRTMLGEEQERMYLGNLRRSRGTWNVMANGVMFARLAQTDREGKAVAWNDMWDGYVASRNRILKRVEEAKLANFVTLAGDIHSSWVNELKADFDKPESATLGTEFVCTSISSAGVPYEQFKAYADANPHIRHFESRQRGYTLLTATKETMQADMRVLDDVKKRDAAIATLTSYVVEAGKPGATEVKPG
ncbi:MAG: alkaline phosphatase D family protein [Alphaproteobacteria bacterium]|nr:alkaline phosphatase D family protein [Alphaproteobacteria bacterium]